MMETVVRFKFRAEFLCLVNQKEFFKLALCSLSTHVAQVNDSARCLDLRTGDVTKPTILGILFA